MKATKSFGSGARFCLNLKKLLTAIFSLAFLLPYFYSFLSFSVPSQRDIARYILINEGGWTIRTIALNGLFYGLMANFALIYFINRMKGLQFKYNLWLGLVTLCV